MKTIIIGGGPTGLGAAWRFNELGYDNWMLCEANEYWGGLASSFQDKEGFWWDIGGHVLFSHYHYFDKVMDEVLKDKGGWVVHNREAWIWMQDRFISYPLQNNIHKLPKDIYWECLSSIIDIQKNNNLKKPENFGQWIEATFGKGLAKWFLNPYNYKVWAYPVDQMGWSWVGERVAPVDLKSILKNAVFQDESKSWGPNSTFRFPSVGGTGAIWRSLAEKLPSEKLHLNKQVKAIDTNEKYITFNDGTIEKYDILFSTVPLTHLIKMAKLESPFDVPPKLDHSSTHVVGIALNGSPRDELASKCWIYFPEDNCPFYRVTVFSNYSPNNVPDNKKQWSLMCEVSESHQKKVDATTIVEDIIQGALNTRLISDRSEINHTWYRFEEKGYPTPSIERDKKSLPFFIELEEKNIFSRGRFGAWKYEVGNMDHSFMQGVEFVNHMVATGDEITFWYPDIVNSEHPSGKKR